MRDLTRSVVSLSWALPLFGAEQMANMVPGQPDIAPTLRSAFRAGERLQQSAVDITFSFVGYRSSANGASSVVEHPAAAAPATDAESSTNSLSTGLQDVLIKVGNVAFELIQFGVTSVYSVTGLAWVQLQGLPGWGPMPEPPPVTAPSAPASPDSV